MGLGLVPLALGLVPPPANDVLQHLQHRSEDKLENAWNQTWQEIQELTEELTLLRQEDSGSCEQESATQIERRIQTLRQRTRRYRQVLRH